MAQQSWEYKSVLTTLFKDSIGQIVPNVAALNDAGNEGWEAFGVMQLFIGNTQDSAVGLKAQNVFVFLKRLKSD